MRKKHAGWLVLSLAVAAALPAAAQRCELLGDGRVQEGVEPGCWVFVNEDGRQFDISGAQCGILREGLSGSLIGFTTDIPTTCQQGPLTEVCRFIADDSLILRGRVRFTEAQGGCWYLETRLGRFALSSCDDALFRDGMIVGVNALETGFSEICLGALPVIDVVYWTPLGDD